MWDIWGDYWVQRVLARYDQIICWTLYMAIFIDNTSNSMAVSGTSFLMSHMTLWILSKYSQSLVSWHPFQHDLATNARMEIHQHAWKHKTTWWGWLVISGWKVFATSSTFIHRKWHVYPHSISCSLRDENCITGSKRSWTRHRWHREEPSTHKTWSRTSKAP